jgi:hypothetical protein
MNTLRRLNRVKQVNASILGTSSMLPQAKTAHLNKEVVKEEPLPVSTATVQDSKLSQDTLLSEKKPLEQKKTIDLPDVKVLSQKSVIPDSNNWQVKKKRRKYNKVKSKEITAAEDAGLEEKEEEEEEEEEGKKQPKKKGKKEGPKKPIPPTANNSDNEEEEDDGEDEEVEEEGDDEDKVDIEALYLDAMVNHIKTLSKPELKAFVRRMNTLSGSSKRNTHYIKVDAEEGAIIHQWARYQVSQGKGKEFGLTPDDINAIKKESGLNVVQPSKRLQVEQDIGYSLSEVPESVAALAADPSKLNISHLKVHLKALNKATGETLSENLSSKKGGQSNAAKAEHLKLQINKIMDKHFKDQQANPKGGLANKPEAKPSATKVHGLGDPIEQPAGGGSATPV